MPPALKDSKNGNHATEAQRESVVILHYRVEIAALLLPYGILLPQSVNITCTANIRLVWPEKIDTNLMESKIVRIELTPEHFIEDCRLHRPILTLYSHLHLFIAKEFDEVIFSSESDPEGLIQVSVIRILCAIFKHLLFRHFFQK